MGQKKLVRFEAIKSFPNVLQSPENMQGKWHEYFRNHAPITLELACGKGEYSVSLFFAFDFRRKGSGKMIHISLISPVAK